MMKFIKKNIITIYAVGLVLLMTAIGLFSYYQSTNISGVSSPSYFKLVSGDVQFVISSWGLKTNASTTFNGVKYMWPAADGSANQRLTTDGSGNLSWVSGGSASLPAQLGQIGDVSTSTLAYGHLLMFDGSNWQDTATSSLGITGAMTYPGTGIALSTGSAWGSSITNNSANWNTAYGWGNHAGLYDIYGQATSTKDWFLTQSNTYTGAKQTFINASTTQIGSTGSAYFATTAGNVGIGTTVPTSALHVVGNIRASQNIDSYGTTEGFRLFTTAGTQKWNLTLQNSGADFEVTESGVAGGRLYIKAGGNVGIGTTSPTAEFHVSSTRTTGYPPFFQISAGKVPGQAASVAFTRANNTQQTFFAFETIDSSNPDGYFGTIAGKEDALYILTALGNTEAAIGIDSVLGLRIGAANNVVSGSVGASITPAGQGYFAGNVGIGTTTPNWKFSINGAGNGFAVNSSGVVVQGIWNGTAIANAYLANSTISGIPLGSNLAALTATDTTLTFSGSYTGATARTVGLNLGNANTWTGLQTFNNATTTILSASYASSTLANFGTATVGIFLDASGAALEIPNGAAPVVDATGEVAIDTTSDQFIYYGASDKKVLVPFYTMSFTMSSSTWGTATTTIYLAPAKAALTIVDTACETSVGTLGVSLYDGTNRANYIPTASTTKNTFIYSTNNTFTANESMRVDVGTAASSPTAISCRWKYVYDVD